MCISLCVICASVYVHECMGVFWSAHRRVGMCVCVRVWVQVPTQVCVPVPVPIQENTCFVIKDSVRRGSWVILTHVREVKTHTVFFFFFGHGNK